MSGLHLVSIETTVLTIGSNATLIRELDGLPYLLESAKGDADALERLQREPVPEIVLLKVDDPVAEGLRTLERVRHFCSKVVIVLPTADARTAMEAIRLGAHEVLTDTQVPHELAAALQRITNPAGSQPRISLPTPNVEELTEEMCFVAASPTMLSIRAQAELLANINVPVLIFGESGTGKEVVARLIHKLSPRAHRKFLKVNCAALPSELLESELFGYDSGAFTGATKGKLGKFELGDKGTILLDEIAEMPANLQAKLLQVAQDKQFFRLGGDTTISVDVRMLAATNLDVPQAIADKKFREDLYYRLAAFTIYLPPLRERREEIPILFEHFMKRLAQRYFREPLPLSSTLEQACVDYFWPGNLREFENFVKRYLVLRDDKLALNELRPGGNGYGSERESNGRSGTGNGRNGNLVIANPVAPPPTSGNGHSNPDNPPESLTTLLRNMKQETEAQAISRALEKTNWNRKHAARLLRISYRGLLYKIRRHNLVPPTRTDI